MFRPSIRRRLVVTFTTITAVGGLALFFIAGRLLENATIDYFKRDILTETVTLAGTLSGGDHDGDNSVVASPLAQYALRRLRSEPDWQFYVLNEHGQIIDNHEAQLTSPPDLQSPEIQNALSGIESQSIASNAEGVNQLQSAAPILFKDGIVRGVVWLIAPMKPAYDLVNSRWAQLAAIVFPVIGLIVIASLWVSQTLIRPISQLHAAALRIATGQHDERIQLNRQDELGQLARAFNTMVDSLKTLLTAQRSFVSNASHELRAPLMSMKLRVEALKDESLSPDDRRAYLNETYTEVEHMAQLVTSLLMLARLDEGKHPVRVEPYDVAAYLQDIVRNWRIRTAQSGILLQTDIADTLPDIKISAADLRIVLDNLLGNAAKYTPNGGEIWLKANASKNELIIEVTDTGEGFPPENVPHLFERFFRSNLDRNKHIPGTGLGLAIVDAIVKQNGGTVQGMSAGLGKGAAFTVRMPVVKPGIMLSSEK
ncbi:MAG: HAMP domain-containing sensor histidine kinase [Anaerolineae bacterium]